MFTGIIEQLGTVAESSSNRLIVQSEYRDLTLGESVAVSGVCLTVTAVDAGRFTCDVSEETLRRSTLGTLSLGRSVNLERAMKADGRFGGHLVQGHVETTAVIHSITPVGESSIFQFTLTPKLSPYIVPKGSITIDGVSLTVVECTDKLFSVAVIPYTFNHTTLGQKKPGESVNLEPDIVAKYLERLVKGPRRQEPEEGPPEGPPPEELYVKRILPWEALEDHHE